jgi:hypothetical protein
MKTHVFDPQTYRSAQEPRACPNRAFHAPWPTRVVVVGVAVRSSRLAEDHLDLLRASECAQAPLLQRAIVDARLGGEVEVSLLTRLRSVARSLDDIRSIMAPRGRKPQDTVATAFEDLAPSLERFRDQSQDGDDDDAAQLWGDLAEISARWVDIKCRRGEPRSSWTHQALRSHLWGEGGRGGRQSRYPGPELLDSKLTFSASDHDVQDGCVTPGSHKLL